MWSRSLLILLAVSAMAAGLWCGRPALRRRLRRLLLGRDKGWIAQSLGQPLTVAPGNDTWYYPLDAARRRALAIRFHRETAITVEVIGPGSL